MRERAAGPVGEDLLGLGVAAVVLLGLDYHVGGVDEQGVIAPGSNSSPWPWGSEVADAADDQPGGDRLALAGGEGGVFHFGDLGVADPAAQLVIPDRAEIADRRRGIPRR